MDRSGMKKLLDKGYKPLTVTIRKWQSIVEGKGIDEGPNNCALCEAYQHHNCRECPVQQYTGYPYCLWTPYANFVQAKMAKNETSMKECALEELQFLKRLQGHK
jgi:hypothetical protein